jgi:prepilin-type N-terminal cleavage/methylation domain-containing protein
MRYPTVIRAGFTLFEVVMSLLILGVVVLVSMGLLTSSCLLYTSPSPRDH